MSKMKRSVTMEKFARFCRKQGYYILLGICVLMIATIITLSVVLSNNSPDAPAASLPGGTDTPSGGGDITPTPEKKLFAMPMGNDYKVYYGDFIGTQKKVACYGLMFDAQEKDNVLASSSGVVTSNSNQVLVVKYPEQNVMIEYRGLSYTNGAAKNLKAGDIVKSGQVLGEAAGRYNYKTNVLSAVHVDVLDVNTQKRVSSYDKVFDISEK